MTINTHHHYELRARGFTLLELMVAMSVTVILLGMVTFMTGKSMDGYRESRDKVVTGRQGKEAMDAITRDFQAMVARMDGSSNQWLYAAVEPQLGTAQGGPTNKRITNACRLIFFTAASDRYDGDIGGATDGGGDVSAVGYRLVYRDQISGTASTAVGSFPAFTLYRHLVDPDDTFTHLLGQANLTAPVAPAVAQFTNAKDFIAENVLAEDIYELTVTFLVQQANGVKRFTIGSETGTAQYYSFVIKGTGIYTKADSTSAEAAQEGQLVGVELGITVLTERGLVMTEKGGMTQQDILKDYGYHFTHTVSVPRF